MKPSPSPASRMSPSKVLNPACSPTSARAMQATDKAANPATGSRLGLAMRVTIRLLTMAPSVMLSASGVSSNPASFGE